MVFCYGSQGKLIQQGSMNYLGWVEGEAKNGKRRDWKNRSDGVQDLAYGIKELEVFPGGEGKLLESFKQGGEVAESQGNLSTPPQRQ